MSDCSKIRYPSRRTAIAAMLAIARKNRKRDRRCPTGTYLCGSCRSWHLTSKSGNQTPPWEKERATR
jgi:hypothetical protein